MDRFKDRRTQLFGRRADLEHLHDRARRPGLTAVAARPLMGKTWTLTEVARRLIDEEKSLVGYHEATGGETSHLLHAVSDLYIHWLSDATLRDQAVSLWERHRDRLIPKIGQIVGALLDKLGSAVGLTGIVRAAFDELAEGHRDLANGGLQIPVLPYDQACSLIQLVAELSAKRIVLILDAWEQSPGWLSEARLLEGILKHADDWTDTHVFIGLRDQDLDPTRLNDDACRRARNVCRLSRSAEFYPLPLMQQTESDERQRIIDFARDMVPAARDQTDQSILEAIDGYRGVLDFWRNEATLFAARTWEHFAREARNAQALRYIELNHLIAALPAGPRSLAARLAFLPRLDPDRWELFRDILLQDQPREAIDALVDAGVLTDENYPTYGHDTRHVAARAWFIENAKSLLRRTSEICITELAVRINGTNTVSRPFFEALVACSDTARAVQSDAGLLCLLNAARSYFRHNDRPFDEAFESQGRILVTRNPRFTPLISRGLLKRGFDELQAGHNEAAELDFSEVIKLPGAPDADVAEAFYNRAYVKDFRGDHAAAIIDYDSAFRLSDELGEIRPKILCNRGIAKVRCGDFRGAIDDFTGVTELSTAPVEERAQALFNRAVRRDQSLGERADALVDYTAVTQMTGISNKLMIDTLYNRGELHSRMDNCHAAIADCNTIIEVLSPSTRDLARALGNRGVAKVGPNDFDGAIADQNSVIDLADAPAEEVGRAYYNRGVAKLNAGRRGKAIEDFTTAIEYPGTRESDVAQAHYRRGDCKSDTGDHRGAIPDYGVALQCADLPAEDRQICLYNRAWNRAECGEITGAIDELTALLELPPAVFYLPSWTLLLRAALTYRHGDTPGAVADLERVMSVPGVTAETIELARESLRRCRIKH